MNFKKQIQEMAIEFESVLNREYREIIDNVDNDIKPFYEQMSYSLFSGGKRLRPILLLKSYELFGGKNIRLSEKFAVAIECIHSYSLVHDDLPAMDNDDFRRGKPSSHKAFGENIAILVGDGLLNLAFEIMTASAITNVDELKQSIKAMSLICRNSGASGMVGGQVLEIYSGEESTKNALKIEILKTSKLFVASILAGAILANVTDDKLLILEKYAENIGIAFQIKDDIMDKSGPYKGNDAKQKADYHVSTALSALDELDMDTSFYAELAKFMVDRDN